MNIERDPNSLVFYTVGLTEVEYKSLGETFADHFRSVYELQKLLRRRVRGVKFVQGPFVNSYIITEHKIKLHPHWLRISVLHSKYCIDTAEQIERILKEALSK